MTWGKTPVAGARLDLRADAPVIGTGRLFGTTTTDARGYFVLSGVDLTVQQSIEFAAQLGYLKIKYPYFPYQPSCPIDHYLGEAPNSFNVQKPITGLSLPPGTGFDSTPTVVTPVTVTWSAMSTATGYCVSVLNNTTGAWAITGGDCPNTPSDGYKSVGLATTYTIPRLPAGHYQFSVDARTDGVLNAIGWATSYFTVP